MATFRAVLNQVLRLLSEEEVSPATSELTDDYHKLVAGFVNVIKEEIEDAHQWGALWNSRNFTVLAGEDFADLEEEVGADMTRFKLVRLQQSNAAGPAPMVIDITGDDAIALEELDYAELIRRRFLQAGTTNGAPQYFAMRHTQTGFLRLSVHPAPTTERSIRATMVRPQAYLTDSDLDTNISIPTRPLVLGTVWFALQERGEELGVSSLFTEERYRRALDDAISSDWAETGGIDLVAM